MPWNQKQSPQPTTALTLSTNGEKSCLLCIHLSTARLSTWTTIVYDPQEQGVPWLPDQKPTTSISIYPDTRLPPCLASQYSLEEKRSRTRIPTIYEQFQDCLRRDRDGSWSRWNHNWRGTICWWHSSNPYNISELDSTSSTKQQDITPLWSMAEYQIDQCGDQCGIL